MVVDGVVTFCFEGETEEEVDDMIEKIQAAVQKVEPELYDRCSISEDTWDMSEE